MAILSFDETYMSSSDDHGVGNEFEKAGKTFRWVQFVDVDSEVGAVCYPANTAGTDVTIDYTGGSNLGNKVVGISVSLVDISDKAYGFMQTSGVISVRGDGSVAAGDYVIGHSVNGEADTMAAGEEHLVFGVALEADSGANDLFACYLNRL